MTKEELESSLAASRKEVESAHAMIFDARRDYEAEKVRAEAADAKVRELEAKVAIHHKHMMEAEHDALMAETKNAALSRDLGMASTVMATASKIIGSSRPKCPDDLTESEKYELLMATARELLDGMVAALPPSPAEAVERPDGWDEHDRMFPKCDGDNHCRECDKATGERYRAKHAPDSSAGGAV